MLEICNTLNFAEAAKNKYSRKTMADFNPSLNRLNKTDPAYGGISVSSHCICCWSKWEEG
jgi:hypothetical protein